MKRGRRETGLPRGQGPPGELADLIETAIYKEVASQALYLAALKQAHDPGAQTLMSELAEQELGHSRALASLKDHKLTVRRWQAKAVPDLMLSDYLTGPDSLGDANLQDLLIFAMKREQQSVDFYSRMSGLVADAAALELCKSLVEWELGHKLRLETFYDGVYYKEN